MARGRLGIALAVAVALAVAAVVLPAAPARAPAPVAARILFDLGDGTYFWGKALVPDPMAPNASWEATRAAAAALGLPLEWTWFPCCGVALTDMGDRNPPTWPGLFLWNGTAGRWDPSPVGISALVLREGDAIAWYSAAYDPWTYALRRPVPTPDDPFPSVAFRGDAFNSGASPSEAPNGVALAWERDLGSREIGATPAVAYGRVFVATPGGLVALDARDGREVWRNAGVRGFSSPAVFNGTLVVGGADGALHVVDASDGRELRSTRLLARPQFSGITSSPKVLYGRAYVGTFNESGGPGEVVALWVDNGTVAWRYGTGSVHFSSPAIAHGTLYIGVMGRYNTTTQVTFDPPYGLLALGADDGALRWFFPTGGPVAASPTVVGDWVLVAAKDGYVYAVDGEGRERWRAAVGAGVASIAVGEGLAFVGGGAFGGPGRVSALDASGGVRWTFTPNGPVQASVAYGDHKVFFATNTANGTVYCLNATTGTLVWSFTPTPREFILGSPVIAGGRLYAVSDNGHVYAFAGEPPALATLALVAPSGAAPGGEAAVRITVNATAGRATAALLTLALPPALALRGANPAPTAAAGGLLTWDLGELPFGIAREVVVRAAVDPGAAGGTLTIAANLTYRDNDGVAYPPVTAAATIGVARAPPSPPPSLLPGALVAVALVAAAAVTAGFVVRRRRERRGP